MKMIRFGKSYDLDIVGVYKKGKSGKLSVDNIRLVLDNVGELFNGVYNTSLVLCSVQKPLFEKNHPMASGNCAVTGLPMNQRPELMGDLEVIEENITLDQHFKVRQYNYYQQELTSSEVQKVLQDVINKVECFS